MAMKPLAALLLACLCGVLVAQDQQDPLRKFTNITVHLEEAPPDEVFRATGQAGGVEFIPPGTWGAGNMVRLNFDLKDQPFWFGAIRAAGFYGYSFEPMSNSTDDRRVRIVLTRSVRGQRMLLAPPLIVRLEISKSQARSIDLVTYADPALKDWAFAGPPTITELTDADGESLLPDDATPQTTTPAAIIARHPVRLSRVTRQVSSLKGSLTLLIADSMEQWTIPDPVAAAANERTVGSATYSFTSLRRAGRQYELKIRAKLPTDGSFPEGASNLIVCNASIIATDATGLAWSIRDVKSSAEDPHDYTITLVPERGTSPGAIASLTWRMPRGMTSLEFPIDLSDIAFK